MDVYSRWFVCGISNEKVPNYLNFNQAIWGNWQIMLWFIVGCFICRGIDDNFLPQITMQTWNRPFCSNSGMIQYFVFSFFASLVIQFYMEKYYYWILCSWKTLGTVIGKLWIFVSSFRHLCVIFMFGVAW